MEFTGKDLDKINCDIRITGCIGNKYELIINEGKNISLTGRGIEKKGNYYIVTDKALEKIEKEYQVVSDF